MSERTVPVVEVTMYVRVTQHDGNLHPHSAASSVVNRQDAKMEPQPVLHMLTCGVQLLGIGEHTSAQIAL
jgi:hypothetical protein